MTYSLVCEECKTSVNTLVRLGEMRSQEVRSIFLADNVYCPLQLHAEWSGVALSMQLTVCVVHRVQSRVTIAASPMQSRIALSMQRVEEGRGNLPSKSCHSLSGLDPPPSPFSKEITTGSNKYLYEGGSKRILGQT